jgi:hypothetical protein
MVSAGVNNAGWSKLQTVTSISSAAGSVRNVNGVPQCGQKERTRPAHRKSFGSPTVNRNSFRRNDAQVTNGAPLLRRQSEQWQWVML